MKQKAPKFGFPFILLLSLLIPISLTIGQFSPNQIGSFGLGNLNEGKNESKSEQGENRADVESGKKENRTEMGSDLNDEQTDDDGRGFKVKAVGGDYERLYNTILNTKARNFRPGNHSNPVMVKVAHYLLNVQQVDEESGQAKLTMREQIQWTDERLAWDPNEFGGIQHFYAPKSKIEKNAEFSDGTVTSLYYLQVTLSIVIHVSEFPFDTQEIKLFWGHSLAGGDEMDITVMVHNLTEARLRGFHFVENEQWRVLSMNCQRHESQFTAGIYERYPYEFCLIRLERLAGFYILNFCIPALLVTFMGITGMHCVSSIPNQRNSKLQLGLMNMMGMSVICLSVANSMPRSNKVSKMHAFYLLLCGLISSTGLMACLTMLLNNSELKLRRFLQSIRVLSYVLHLIAMTAVTFWFFPHTAFEYSHY